jgi:hypothetical protein
LSFLLFWSDISTYTNTIELTWKGAIVNGGIIKSNSFCPESECNFNTQIPGFTLWVQLDTHPDTYSMMDIELLSDNLH